MTAGNQSTGSVWQLHGFGNFDDWRVHWLRSRELHSKSHFCLHAYVVAQFGLSEDNAENTGTTPTWYSLVLNTEFLLHTSQAYYLTLTLKNQPFS